MDREDPATCSVGVSGVDIDPYGNVQACLHLQESAGNIHEQSIEEIWNNSPLFQRARARAVAAARRFADKSPRQFGAPVFCLAVEENCGKGMQQRLRAPQDVRRTPSYSSKGKRRASLQKRHIAYGE